MTRVVTRDGPLARAHAPTALVRRLPGRRSRKSREAALFAPDRKECRFHGNRKRSSVARGLDRKQESNDESR